MITRADPGSSLASHSAISTRSGDLSSILTAGLVGAFLRMWNVRDQVLVGDEIHALRAALDGDLATVLTTYRDADPCLPLAGLFRLAIDLGIPISEMLMRLPILLTGILTVVALPLLLGRLAPATRPARALLAWLLALSPALILYSRIVRPYAPIVLWCGLAAGCFWIFWSAWRDGEDSRSADSRRYGRFAVAGFLVSATLAVWFHLGTAPFVAALFGYALLDLAIARPADWLRLARKLVFTGFAVAAVVALPLLPAATSLQHLATSKRVAVVVPAATYAAVARLDAGTASPLIAALFWAVALAGLVRLLYSSPRAGMFSVALVGGQLLGIRVLSPVALEIPIAFHRYLLPTLPLVLLWVAVALRSPWLGGRWSGLESRYVGVLRGVLLAGLFFAGPLVDRQTWSTSFLHDEPYVDFSRQPPRPNTSRWPPAEILAPAEWLRQQPGTRPIIEATWPPNRYGSRIFALAQQVHGRRVIVVAPGLAGQSTVSFRNFVAPAPNALLATDAQFLIVRGAAGRSAPDASALPKQLRRHWGKPTWRQGDVQVWDLDALRSRLR